MTEEEEKAIAFLKEAKAREYSQLYSRLIYISRLTTEALLKQTGHESIGAGMIWTFERTRKKVKDFLKKHPD